MSSYGWPILPCLTQLTPRNRSLNHNLLIAPLAVRKQQRAASYALHRQNPNPRQQHPWALLTAVPEDSSHSSGAADGLSEGFISHLPAPEGDLPVGQKAAEASRCDSRPLSFLSKLLLLVLYWVGTFYISIKTPTAVIPALSWLTLLCLPPKHKENRIIGLSINLRPS